MNLWNVSIPDAIAIQHRLRERLAPHPPIGFVPQRVAGADISIERDSTVGYAGIVVIDRASMETIEVASAIAEIHFPYVPGLLSFRELPALERAWERLKEKPDVLIFDGAGYAHPRRFGLACHGGLLFDIPSIGCAKSILIGTPAPLANEAGSAAPLMDGGEVIGMALRLRAGAKPVYVSVGHRMDLPTAVAIVGAMGAGYREPETTRRAHRLVNALRRQQVP